MSEDRTRRIVSVDQIDNDVAVLVGKRRRAEVPAAWLPPNASEGSVLRIVLKMEPDDEQDVADRIRQLQSRGRRGRKG